MSHLARDNHAGAPDKFWRIRSSIINRMTEKKGEEKQENIVGAELFR
jgi:hypothetical protein